MSGAMGAIGTGMQAAGQTIAHQPVTNNNGGSNSVVKKNQTAPTTASTVLANPSTGSGTSVASVPPSTSIPVAPDLDLQNQPDSSDVRADVDLQEPNSKDPASWTIREEDNYILAKNQKTGDMKKIAMEPLSKEEMKQAEMKHGAGPLGKDNPNRMQVSNAPNTTKMPSNMSDIKQQLLHSLIIPKLQEMEMGLEDALNKKFKGNK